MCICLTLNYHTFNLNFMHLHVRVMLMFRSKFPFKDNKVLSYLYLILILSHFSHVIRFILCRVSSPSTNVSSSGRGQVGGLGWQVGWGGGLQRAHTRHLHNEW